jgi:ankyrin repeat protein
MYRIVNITKDIYYYYSSDFNAKKLIRAVRDRNTDLVRELLTIPHINVNKADENGCTPLCRAIWQECSGIISEMLLSIPRIDVNKADINGSTPLYWAVYNGEKDIAKMLLSIPRIDVNKANFHGKTPLYWAASKGYSDIVERLLAMHDIDVNKADKDGLSPLYWAAFNGFSDIVEMLLSMPHIDVNKANKYGETPLYWAASKGFSDIVEILLAKPRIDVNKANFHGKTPLYWAAINGFSDIIVKILIEKGASRGNDKSKVTNQNILKMLEAQEYIDDLMSNKSIEPRELTEELEQMVVARVENRLESSFASKDVIFDIARFEAILSSQKDTHPVLCTILEKLHSMKENVLCSDMEAAKKYYNLSTCADFDQLKNIWGVEGKNTRLFQQLLDTYKNSKKDMEVMANLNLLKKDFGAYLEQKADFIAKNGGGAFNVPEQFIDQVDNLFARLVEIVAKDGSKDIEALSPEELEAILFYSLNPQYQHPGILTQEVACRDLVLSTDFAFTKDGVELYLSGELDTNQDDMVS